MLISRTLILLAILVAPAVEAALGDIDFCAPHLTSAHIGKGVLRTSARIDKSGKIFHRIKNSDYWFHYSSSLPIPDVREMDQSGILKPLILDLSDVFAEVIAHGEHPTAMIVGYDELLGRLFLRVDAQDVSRTRIKRSLPELFVFDLSHFDHRRHVKLSKRIVLPTISLLPEIRVTQMREAYYQRLARDAVRIESVVTFFDGGALLIGWKYRGVQAVTFGGGEIAPELFRATDSLGNAILLDQKEPQGEAPVIAGWGQWTQRGQLGQIWSAPLLTPDGAQMLSGKYLEIDTDAILLRRAAAISRIR